MGAKFAAAGRYLEPTRGGAIGPIANGTTLPTSAVPSTLDANQLVLQAQVLAEWTGFARNGNPSPAATPLWARYSSAGRPVMTLLPAGESGLSPTATITSEHHCGYWDAVNRSAPWAGG
jgi:para-nitrobenzyl esterase